MSLSEVPAKPAWVSHADNSVKTFSSMPRLYRLPPEVVHPAMPVDLVRTAWLFAIRLKVVLRLSD
jgi:hypothetical protein